MKKKNYLINVYEESYKNEPSLYLEIPNLSEHITLPESLRKALQSWVREVLKESRKDIVEYERCGDLSDDNYEFLKWHKECIEKLWRKFETEKLRQKISNLKDEEVRS